MRVSPGLYRSQNWLIHDLAKDFSLIDCWEIPIPALDQTHSFTDVFKFLACVDPADSHPVTKFLFELRFMVGRVCHLDKGRWLPIPGTGEMSLAERLTQSQQAKNLASTVKIPENKAGQLRPVYLDKDEGIIEISNKTIFAFIHFGQTDQRKIWMGIYIKSRGALSDVYMGVIKPFRHVIVYPTWLKHIAREWKRIGGSELRR